MILHNYRNNYIISLNFSFIKIYLNFFGFKSSNLIMVCYKGVKD